MLDAADLHALDPACRGLVLKLHDVSHQLDHLAGLSGRIALRHYLKRHARSLRPADLVYGLLYRLPHDVLKLAVLLLYADDLVARLDAPVKGHGAIRHYPADLQRAVVRAKFGANSCERQVHLHVEVLLGRLAHVAGVRIVRSRQAVEIVLKNRLGIGLGNLDRILAVLLQQILLRRVGLALLGSLVPFFRIVLIGLIVAVRALGLLRRLLLDIKLAREHLGENLVLDLLSPEVLGLLAGLRPRRVLALDAVDLIGREVPLGGRQKVRREVVPFPETLDEDVVDVEAEADVAMLKLVVERLLAGREAIQVALQEDRMVDVVVCHQIGPCTLGNDVVQSPLQDMVSRQHRRKARRDLPVVGLRRNLVGRAKLRRKQDGQRDRHDSRFHLLISIRLTSRSSSSGGIITRSVSKLFRMSHELMTTAP